MTKKRLRRLIMSLGIQRNDADAMLHECRIIGWTHADYWTQHWKLIHIRALWLLKTADELGMQPTLKTSDASGGIIGSADFSRLANALRCAAEAFIAGAGPAAVHAAQELRRFSEAANEAKNSACTYYLCNPELNKECNKQFCAVVNPYDPESFCDSTTNPAFAETDGRGMPIVKY